jgi:hypothetical protein
MLRAEDGRDIQVAEVHQGIQTMPTFGRAGPGVAEQRYSVTVKAAAQRVVFQ